MIFTPNKKQGSKSLRSLAWWTPLLVGFLIVVLAGVLVLLVGLNVFAYPRVIPTPVTPSPVAPRPFIELSPAEGAPGTVIAVVGAGWLPGDAVLVHLDALWPESSQEGETPLASATVAEDGQLVASFAIPSNLNWETLPHYVLVTARSPATGDEASAVLRILATGPTPSPEPTPTPQPTVRPEPSPTPGCLDRISFVSDVTIPDYTRLSPGQSFVKTWRLRNSGSCTWTTDYALVFAGGHRMGGPLVVPLRGLVAPGGTVDLSVTLTTPAGNGTYEGRWQLRSADGHLFGTGSSAKGVFWVRIVVGPTPTPTPALTKWRGEYYGNANLTGAPVLVRSDAAVDFNWRYSAPATGLAVDGFSARWTRSLSFEEGLYRFHVVVDDAVRLYVDDALVIDAWYDGARREVTADRRLSGGYHNLRVEYYERTGEALIHLWWEKLASYPDWRGEYWSNRSLDGKPALVRNDIGVDFNWALGAPAAGVPVDKFSARWTRTAHFDAATYRFHILVDDGARLWVDDQLVIDAWRDGAAREVRANHALASGTHSLRVEFYEHTGHAQIRLWWEKVSSPSYPDWKGEYWSNRSFSGGPALVRNDATIDFRWGAGAVAAGLPADKFSARWSRQVAFEPGVYRFYAWADDGIRVYVDKDLVLNEWHDSTGDEVYMVDLPLRDRHQLVVEYYERNGQALAKFWWKRVGAWPTPTPVSNRPPVAMADSATTSEDTPVSIGVLANDHDPDGDTLTVTAYSTASAGGGTVSCTSAGECTYDPPASFSGTDTFTYTISDGKGGTSTATVTVSVTANPTPAPASVRLNEVLPAPAAVDWNGDGITDEKDEWIELHNAGTSAVDLSGWSLDSGITSTVAYTIPEETVLRPGGFMVFYRDKTGVVLTDQGGKVRLLDSEGAVVDVVTFEILPADASYSRDSAGSWHSDWPPSPGEPNQPPAAMSLLRRTGTPLRGLLGSSGDLLATAYRR